MGILLGAVVTVTAVQCRCLKCGRTLFDESAEPKVDTSVCGFREKPGGQGELQIFCVKEIHGRGCFTYPRSLHGVHGIVSWSVADYQLTLVHDGSCPGCDSLTQAQHDHRVTLPEGDQDRCTGTWIVSGWDRQVYPIQFVPLERRYQRRRLLKASRSDRLKKRLDQH